MLTHPPSPFQECLEFDNEIASLEKAIASRRAQLQELESMCSDAQLAREMAKVGN